MKAMEKQASVRVSLKMPNHQSFLRRNRVQVMQQESHLISQIILHKLRKNPQSNPWMINLWPPPRNLHWRKRVHLIVSNPIYRLFLASKLFHISSLIRICAMPSKSSKLYRMEVKLLRIADSIWMSFSRITKIRTIRSRPSLNCHSCWHQRWTGKIHFYRSCTATYSPNKWYCPKNSRKNLFSKPCKYPTLNKSADSLLILVILVWNSIHQSNHWI